jgi:hypothetical protein
MIIRAFRESDIEPISDIWEQYHSTDYGLPDRSKAVIDAVVEHEGKVIGYGQVKLFAEAMLFLDKDAPQRPRILALKALMLEAFRGTESAGLNELYAFINDPKLLALIQKHFHFTPAERPGQLLIKEL